MADAGLNSAPRRRSAGPACPASRGARSARSHSQRGSRRTRRGWASRPACLHHHECRPPLPPVDRADERWRGHPLAHGPDRLLQRGLRVAPWQTGRPDQRNSFSTIRPKDRYPPFRHAAQQCERRAYRPDVGRDGGLRGARKSVALSTAGQCGRTDRLWNCDGFAPTSTQHARAGRGGGSAGGPDRGPSTRRSFVAPGAENGGRRAINRRPRSRLQQPLDDHRRKPRPHSSARERRTHYQADSIRF